MASGQSNWPLASPNWLLVSSNWVANPRIIAYLCSLLMEFIETFYACLGKHFMVIGDDYNSESKIDLVRYICYLAEL